MRTPRVVRTMAKVKVEFVYSGLRVRNLPRSLRFYPKLGFRVHKRGTMEHGGRWAHLAFPGAAQRVELNYYPPRTPFYEPHRKGTEFDHLGFRVSDVEAWEKDLRRRKFTVVARIREQYENLLYIRDPDGNWLEFFGPVPE
jgi:catechol 2,3-dioxygenase-like lactoylglutathione lyase family enzyme